MKVTDAPWAGRVWAVLATLLASYAGYDQYEKATTSTETTVNVNVEGIDAAPGSLHAHGEVLSRESIQAIVAAAIAAQHQKDVKVFKKCEEWDNC